MALAPSIHLHTHLEFTDCCKGVFCCTSGGDFRGFKNDATTGYKASDLTCLFKRAYPNESDNKSLEFAKKFGGGPEEPSVIRNEREALKGIELKTLSSHVQGISSYSKEVVDLFERLKSSEIESEREGQGDGNSFFKSLASRCSEGELEGLLETFGGKNSSETESFLKEIINKGVSLLDFDPENFWKMVSIVKKVKGVVSEILPSLEDAVQFESQDRTRHIWWDPTADEGKGGLVSVSRFRYNITNGISKSFRNKDTYDRFCNVVSVDEKQQELFNGFVDQYTGSDLSARYKESQGIYPRDILERWEGQKKIAPYWRGIYSFYNKYILPDSESGSNMSLTYIKERDQGAIDSLLTDKHSLNEASKGDIECLKTVIANRSEFYAHNLLNVTGGSRDILDFACSYLNLPYRHKNNEFLTEDDYILLLKELTEGVEITPNVVIEEESFEPGRLLLLYSPLKDLYQKLWFQKASEEKTSSEGTLSFFDRIKEKVWKGEDSTPKINEYEEKAIAKVFLESGKLEEVKTSKSLAFLGKENIDLFLETLEETSRQYETELLKSASPYGEELISLASAYMQVNLTVNQSLRFFREEDFRKIKQGILSLKDYFQGMKNIVEEVKKTSVRYSELEDRFDCSSLMNKELVNVIRENNIDLFDLNDSSVEILYAQVVGYEKLALSLKTPSVLDKKLTTSSFFISKILSVVKCSTTHWNKRLLTSGSTSEAVSFAKLHADYSKDIKVSEESIYEAVLNKIPLGIEYDRALRVLQEHMTNILSRKRSRGVASFQSAPTPYSIPVGLNSFQTIEFECLMAKFSPGQEQNADNFAQGDYPEVLREHKFTSDQIKLLFNVVENISLKCKEIVDSESFWKKISTEYALTTSFTEEEKIECINITSALNVLSYRHNPEKKALMTVDDIELIQDSIGSVYLKYKRLMQVYHILQRGSSPSCSNKLIFDALTEQIQEKIRSSESISDLNSEIISRLMRLTTLLPSKEVDSDLRLEERGQGGWLDLVENLSDGE
jgi:hypothetical protein